MTVRFERRGDITAITLAIYDPDVVAIIKTIPSFVRSWNPIRREWLVFEPVYATVLGAALHSAGHVVIGIEPDPDDDTDWARALFRRVGPHRAGPVFRSLTKILHPDNPATGDTQLQRELNTAHGELTA